MILEVFPSGPIETNTILIACEVTKQAAIVDAPQDCTLVLQSRVGQLGLSVQMILLTHSHQDHIADARSLKNKFKAPVYIHALDAPNLQTPGADLLPIFIPVEPVTPDGFLSDGQILHLGELAIQVIHTPGHTPGGVCFYVEKEKTLISGDTLFQGTMGRIDFPQSNPDAMGSSLKKLAALPFDTTVFPGHGGPTTIGEEAYWLQNPKRRVNDD